MRPKQALVLVIADSVLSHLLFAKGTEANLPLLGFLFMGNVLVLVPRHGAWRGFGIGGIIAASGFLACCWLFPVQVLSLYETLVVPLSGPLEDALFTDRLARSYDGGAIYGPAAVYTAATLVNGFESFLMALPQVALASLGGFASLGITRAATTALGNQTAGPDARRLDTRHE